MKASVLVTAQELAIVRTSGRDSLLRSIGLDPEFPVFGAPDINTGGVWITGTVLPIFEPVTD